MLINHRRAIGKIYLVAGLSLLLLTGSFYLFGFKPLSDRLNAEHTLEIEHFLHSNLLLIQSALNKHYDLAQQTASRTAIRKKQAAYLRGEVSREQLVAFSVPKLNDAMGATEEIVGIARFDPTGRLLFNVGQQLPEGVAERCGLQLLEEIRMLDPMEIAGTRHLLYCSPIDDRHAGRIGADILIMREDAIQQIIDDPWGFDNKAIIASVTSPGGIIYWPGKLGDSVPRGVLEKFIDSGATENNYLVTSEPLEKNDWLLYAVVNKEQFFADIRRQLLMLLSVIAAATALLFALTVAVLRPIIRTLLKENLLAEQSRLDGLTGLYHHGYMQELLERELARSQRYKHPLSILMFDVDHFKQVNDKYGHIVGDDVLRNIAQLLQDHVRKGDVAARYGGEEFVMILPETGKEGAAIMAERMRSEVASQRVATETGELTVTISIGVVSYDAGKCEITKRSIIQRVDKAMYASKDSGRNTVTLVTIP